MWKYKFKFVNIIIVCFIYVCFSSYSFAYESIPKYVKIGLKYGNSAVQTSSLQSNSGFKIFSFNGDNMYDLLNITDTSIKVRKGSYRIQVDRQFNSMEDALSTKRELEDKNINTYIFYDGNYYLYLDSFDSKEEDLLNLQYNYNMVEPKNSSVEITNQSGKTLFAYDSNKEIGITNNSSGVISVDGKKYRGSIIPKRTGGANISIINKLPLNEYLYGVVPKEMSGSWPIESLKAQAVAARNYAVMNIGKKHSKDGFDLCPTDHCQVYGGYESESSNSNKAVLETGNKIMIYDNKVIDALYHSNSGGKTEDSENIYVNKIPYLRGVDDQFSIGYPNDNWTVSLSKQDIQNKLAQNKVNIGELIDVNIEESSKNGRVLKIKFIGTNGEKIYSKDSVRSLLGLKSTYFDIIKDGNSTNSNTNSTDFSIISSDKTSLSNNIYSLNIITSSETTKINKSTELNLKGDTNIKKIDFSNTENIQNNVGKYVLNGHGWGHGVGMSQWGAKKMAESGYTYEDILKHYYTGIQIVE